MPTEFDRARARVALGGAIPVLPPVRTDGIVGSIVHPAVFDQVERDGVSWGVYRFEYEGTVVVAASPEARLDTPLEAMVNSRQPWAHELRGPNGRLDVPIAVLWHETTRTERGLDLGVAASGTWWPVAGSFPFTSGTRMLRVDSSRVLLVNGESAALFDAEDNEISPLGSAEAWGGTLDIIPEYAPDLDADQEPFRVLSVRGDQVSIFSSFWETWRQVGPSPAPDAALRATVRLRDWRVLALFHVFEYGSDGGFDYSEEVVFPWIFDAWNETWAPCETAGTLAHRRDLGFGRLPIATAVRLTDGRVLACEGGDRYVFDAGRLDSGLAAGPRLDQDEESEPALFALPGGDALIVTEVTDYRSGSREALVLRWDASREVLGLVFDWGAWTGGVAARLGSDVFMRLGGATAGGAVLHPGTLVRARGLEYEVVADGADRVEVRRPGSDRTTQIPRSALSAAATRAPVQAEVFTVGPDPAAAPAPAPPVDLHEPRALGFRQNAVLVGTGYQAFVYSF